METLNQTKKEYIKAANIQKCVERYIYKHEDKQKYRNACRTIFI